jgi:hypothetical protein
MTAPLFLFVSGWAVMTRALRLRLFGKTVVKKHLSRAGVLLLIAVALRWPSWNTAGLWRGEREPWEHLLGMDALSCIAACLAISGVALAPRAGLWTRLVVFAGLAAIAPYAARFTLEHHPPFPFLGGLLMTKESPFPLFPWSGFFFSGVGVAIGLDILRTRPRQALGLLILGLVGLAGTALLGLDGLPTWSPRLFCYRLGFVASVGGITLAVPERVLRGSMAVGRASLTTYVLHLPLLYGWGNLGGLRGQLGASLDPVQAGILALAFVLVGTGLSSVRRAFSESQQPSATNEAA